MEKRYEEALERARNGMSIDEIFPELKESEDERIRKELIEYLTHKAEVTGFVDEDRDCKRWIAYLEKQKDEAQKQFNLGMQAGREEVVYEMEKEQQLAEWSEEDEEMFERFLGWLQGTMGEKTYSSWLKSLRERFSLEPKQEWSEEDEKNIEKLDGFLSEVYIYGRVYISQKDKDELQNWLKSLRPQPNTVSVENATEFGSLEYERGVKDGIQSEKSRHWKPSEEQMKALKETAEWKRYSNPQLFSLYHDLLKLS